MNQDDITRILNYTQSEDMPNFDSNFCWECVQEMERKGRLGKVRYLFMGCVEY